MTERKKIAFVVAMPGSADSFLIDHFTCLTKDYDVTLIANFIKFDALKAKFEAMNVRCIHAPIERPISLFNDFKGLLALYKIFKKEKFVSVHSVTPKAGLLTAFGGWLARVPHRIHIFTGQVWATKRGAMRVLLKFMDRLIAWLDTDLLVDGESQRQFLIQEGVLSEKNSKVLADGSIAGVKLERFFISEETRNTERAKYGFTEDDVVFVFMGRLNHDKGIGELYEAFDKLVSECPKAKLLLFGIDEGGYDGKADTFKNIRRGINYFYPGSTQTPFASLQAGDVFCIPTWREGFGMSVIEAQALGLPVITSDAYGVLSASVEGVTGLRCRVGDSQSLYERMLEYYQDSEMRRKHGEAGRKRVVEKFDNAIVSKAWVDFYKELLK